MRKPQTREECELWLRNRCGEWIDMLKATGVAQPTTEGWSLVFIALVCGNAVDDGVMTRAQSMQAGFDLIDSINQSANEFDALLQRMMKGE